MSNLTISEIKHLSKLAQLDIKHEQLQRFTDQLNEILSFVEQLNAVKTGPGEVIGNITGQKNVFRDDIIGKSLSQDECLKNAPQAHDGYFKVKAVFENE